MSSGSWSHFTYNNNECHSTHHFSFWSFLTNYALKVNRLGFKIKGCIKPFKKKWNTDCVYSVYLLMHFFTFFFTYIPVDIFQMNGLKVGQQVGAADVFFFTHHVGIYFTVVMDYITCWQTKDKLVDNWGFTHNANLNLHNYPTPWISKKLVLDHIFWTIWCLKTCSQYELKQEEKNDQLCVEKISSVSVSLLTNLQGAFSGKF